VAIRRLGLLRLSVFGHFACGMFVHLSFLLVAFLSLWRFCLLHLIHVGGLAGCLFGVLCCCTYGVLAFWAADKGILVQIHY
jgi:hypothetical protein